jgi:hypothetical protein
MLSEEHERATSRLASPRDRARLHSVAGRRRKSGRAQRPEGKKEQRDQFEAGARKARPPPDGGKRTPRTPLTPRTRKSRGRPHPFADTAVFLLRNPTTSLLSQSLTPTAPRRAVGFFGFGRLPGYPFRRITRSTSDWPSFNLGQPFRPADSDCHAWISCRGWCGRRSNRPVKWRLQKLIDRMSVSDHQPG